MRPMRPRRVVVRPMGAPLLRGALVGGAAYAAGESRARAPQVDDIASKLARLGDMVQQGLLTPEEFTAAKAKLLS